MTEIEFWEYKEKEAKKELVEATLIYEKQRDRYTLALAGKPTQSMVRIYNDWKSMQPRGAA